MKFADFVSSTAIRSVGELGQTQLQQSHGGVRVGLGDHHAVGCLQRRERVTHLSHAHPAALGVDDLVTSFGDLFVIEGVVTHARGDGQVEFEVLVLAGT